MRDSRTSPKTDAPDASPVVTGADGKQYPAKKKLAAIPQAVHNPQRASPGRRPARRLLGMESTPTMIELFPHECFDPIRRRWVKARHRATLADLGMDGAPFRVLGPPERREVRDASALTAGHLASRPK